MALEWFWSVGEEIYRAALENGLALLRLALYRSSDARTQEQAHAVGLICQQTANGQTGFGPAH